MKKFFYSSSVAILIVIVIFLWNNKENTQTNSNNKSDSITINSSNTPRDNKDLIPLEGRIGTPITGWQKIDEKDLFFDENGNVVR